MKKKGVKGDFNDSILTAEISKAIFGMKPSEYQKFKGLEKENLCDYMIPQITEGSEKMDK